MTLRPPLFAQNSSYPASHLRDLISATLHPGAVGIGDLRVSQRGAGPNMSVDVSPGQVVVPSEVASRGSYLCSSTAVESVSLDASPGAGSSRVDLIVAQVTDAEYGDPADGWTLSAVTGTPGSSPSAPSAPAGSVVLAEVAVGSEVAAITDADVTDRRSFASPTIWLNGEALPPSGTPGQVAVGADGTPHWRTGSAWVAGVSAGLFGAREARVDSFSVPASLVSVTGTTLSIPQPSGAVTVHASFDGRCALSGTVEIYSEVSFDGGLSWVAGGSSRQQTDGSAAQAISCHATKTGTPSGQVRCRLRAQRIGGSSSAALTGQWSMLVQPAGV